MAVFYVLPLSDLFEAFTDFWETLCLRDEVSMVTNQRQSHTEQDLGSFVEKAVPYSQHCLKEARSYQSLLSIFA